MKVTNRFLILLVSFIVLFGIYSTQTQDQPPDSTKNIFKSPEETDVAEAEKTIIPWVKDEFEQKIQDFKNILFERLQQSPQVMDIWNVQSDSEEIRRIFFKIPTRYLTDLGRPNPPAKANIISEAASLHNPLTMPIFFEVIAVNIGEFLLAHNKDPDTSAAEKYVGILSSEIRKADLNDVESVWLATYTAYQKFAELNGFNFKDIIDEILDLFISELIVLSKQKKYIQ